MNVQPAPEIREAIYNVLIHILSNPTEDLVVRLTAVSTLRVVVDEGLFTDSEIFSTVSGVAINTLLSLINSVEEFETKASILKALESVIQMMGVQVSMMQDVLYFFPSLTNLFCIFQVAPVVPKIMQALPELWETSQDQVLFRTLILTLLTTLIKVSKKKSPLSIF